MRRAARLAAAELAAMRGRRLSWATVVAATGSLVGGLAMGALLVPFPDASPIEASTVVVSRGSAAPVAIAALAALVIASPYRDGSWTHAALAVPAPAARLLASAAPTVLLGTGLGAVAVAVAAAGAALVHPAALAALPVASVAHLAIVAVWSSWMLCLAHATRSPLATLAIGAGLPLVVEPVLAGLLAQSSIAGARWLLPSASLRSLAELPADGRAVLDGPGPELAPLLVVSALGWTLVAATAAWLRARGPMPR